ncbi:MAG: Hpt domain-containing protein [Cyclobacteriaceae bacterium]|nr:Hpt domain-containing protein [Cyclobacteriaceae bacterium]MCH8516463.1 Hpt domain-containing protein [Cyclobacteriaceae bacterium]
MKFSKTNIESIYTAIEDFYIQIDRDDLILSDIFKEWQRQTGEEIEEMKQMVVEKKYFDAFKVCHKIKGSFITLQLNGAAQQLQKLENRLKANEAPQDFSAFLEWLESYLILVEQAFNRILIKS